MASIKCPKCGKQLQLPPIQETQSVRCPACKNTFTVSPPSHPQPLPGEYTGEGAGTFTKAALAILAALGIALIAVLLYRSAVGTSVPKEPPEPVPVAVADTKEGSTPGTKRDKSKKHGEVERPSPIAAASCAKALGELPGLPHWTPIPKRPVLSGEAIYAKASRTVVQIIIQDQRGNTVGSASGFFVSEDGLLVTNNHVIEKGKRFKVVLGWPARKTLPAWVAFADTYHDLAVLGVSLTNAPHLELGHQAPPGLQLPPSVGSRVYVIGNPMGLGGSLSEGVVSGIRREKLGEYYPVKYIQLTASISKGSSGSPVLLADERVIGVCTSYFTGGQNLNFAVPVEYVQKLLSRARKARFLMAEIAKCRNQVLRREIDSVCRTVIRDTSTTREIWGALRRLTGLYKDEHLAWFALGYYLTEIEGFYPFGPKDELTNALRRAAEIDPDYVPARYFLGKALCKVTESWVARRWEANPKSFEDTKTEAISLLKNAIVAGMNDADAFYWLGECYCGWYEAKGDQVDKVFYGLFDPTRQVNTDLGMVGSFQTGSVLAEQHESAYEALPVHAKRLLAGLRETRLQAIDAFRRCLALEPHHRLAWERLADIYEKSDQGAYAVEANRRALAIYPAHRSLWYGVGFLLLRLRRYDEAARAFETDIELYIAGLEFAPDKPGHDHLSHSYAKLGRAYEGMGLREKAIAAYEKAVKLDPEGSYGKRAREALARVRGTGK